MDVDQLAGHVIKKAASASRFIVAIAGPPGAGKSTLASKLKGRLVALGHHSKIVPMDGFHLDNLILEKRGLLGRKGAPETFDAGGFASLIARLSAADDEVYIPVFDRERDIAIAGADCVVSDDRFLIVEGNYLLLNTAPWLHLQTYWNETVLINPGIDVLEQRLVQRWLDHGNSEEDAKKRAQANDLPNARLVLENSARANILIDA